MSTMIWRKTYRVHPAADAFPMMPDDEIEKLAEDIRANTLQNPIVFWSSSDDQTIDDDGLVLIDGRNRLEAMERAGLQLDYWNRKILSPHVDPVATIIGLNIHRRHLTKEQQADLIVAVHKAGADVDLKPRQVGEVSPTGGRGKVNEVKAAAVASAKEHGISRRTVERSLAKTYTNPIKPAPPPTISNDKVVGIIKGNPYASVQMLSKATGLSPSSVKRLREQAVTPRQKPAETTVAIPATIEAAREHYLLELGELPEKEQVAEIQKLIDAIEALYKVAMTACEGQP